MRLWVLIAVAACVAGCTYARVREPSSEDRLTRSLTEPPGKVPDPIAFAAESPRVAAQPPTPSSQARNTVTVGGGFVYPIVVPITAMPTVRSRVLTHPQGVQGGSTPGLLP